MSSSPLSINGASTRENINVEEDPWGFLGTHPSEQESQIKETLKELSAPITALTFLETPVTNSQLSYHTVETKAKPTRERNRTFWGFRILPLICSLIPSFNH